MKKYYLFYKYVSAVSRNYHRLEIYGEDQYTVEGGLVGEPHLTITNTVGKEVWDYYKLSAFFNKKQFENLRTMIAERIDGILSPDNKYLKN